MTLAADSLFRQLAEHSLVGIYIIQDEHFAYVNPTLAGMFGYSDVELLSLDSWLALVAPEDRDLVGGRVRRRLGGEAVAARYGFRGLRRDGTVIDVEVYAKQVDLLGRPAVLGNLIDVTERKRSEEALRASEERFRNAFENTNVPMVLTDLNHRFVRVNEAFARMFGYSPDEMLRMSMIDITHPDDLAESYALREVLKAGEAAHFQVEKRYHHKDGRLLWGRVNVSLLRDARGEPQLYVAQLQDITDRKRLEEQIRHAQKMEAVGLLAGGVAHDFNNLLTVILGCSEILLGGNRLDPADRDLMREVHRAGERAAGLTRQLLAFSRRQVLAPQVLDLNALLRETGRMLQRLIGADVAMSLALAPDLGRIKADPGQVDQVVMNLVVNARDAMPRGGRLTIETRNVELGPDYVRRHAHARPGRYVMVAVSDTGVGMDEATRARVFEPFFTTKGAGRGTGLGLATAHGIVRQSEGHIEVYSEPGRGTTFKVYFPHLAESPSALKLPAAVVVPRGTETVLVAEDDDGIRSLARVALQTNGYTVLEAAAGEEGLRVGLDSPGPVDLLITDVVMPGMGGRELAERLRAARPAMKVLYVSGYTDEAVTRHGILQEGVAFLHKPFTPTTLARKVREVLDAR